MCTSPGQGTTKEQVLSQRRPTDSSTNITAARADLAGTEPLEQPEKRLEGVWEGHMREGTSATTEEVATLTTEPQGM